ncbi:hypothetical protein M0R89_10295 [Halorussus limi]|uniref:Uncharacterized protein n=1 Tax=Halorussus limi TaxID=2938695 RepID=A0A8U0HPY8_9EURY|nr:hypothetical protein [Halorussus limi]UPV72937.1 hypothetical protein M0R89_10295 [Halorussus limi]
MIDRDNDRKQISWDLETTGFAWNAKITVSGFWFPSENGTVELVLNTSDTEIDVDQYETHLENISGATVTVTPADGEAALLEVLQRVVFDRFDREYNRLTAFHGDSWKGGFDLPFLRTRCIDHGIDWVFDNVMYCDVWDPVKKRLNTTAKYWGTHDDVNSLDAAHDILFGDDVPPVLAEAAPDHQWYANREYDPFASSRSASYCYERGELLPVAQHNLADLHRTWELAELVRAYIPNTDITEKKL